MGDDMIRVLVVDDHPVIRQGLRQILVDSEDIEVGGEASDGREAMKHIRNEPWDVVLLDINLPDNNGKAVLDWIMNHDPGACVVMFSSNGSLENITECLNNGASGFITKPFLREDLIHYVQPHNE